MLDAVTAVLYESGADSAPGLIADISVFEV